MWHKALVSNSRNLGLLQIKTIDCPAGQAATTTTHTASSVLKDMKVSDKMRIKAITFVIYRRRKEKIVLMEPIRAPKQGSLKPVALFCMSGVPPQRSNQQDTWKNKHYWRQSYTNITEKDQNQNLSFPCGYPFWRVCHGKRSGEAAMCVAVIPGERKRGCKGK